MGNRYVEQLAQALDAEGWSLVQTLLSSSYLQYGVSNLDKVRGDGDSSSHVLLSRAFSFVRVSCSSGADV